MKGALVAASQTGDGSRWVLKLKGMIMQSEMPDFGVVETIFSQRLSQDGIQNHLVDKGVTTHFEKLELYRSRAEVLVHKPDSGFTPSYYASVEVRAVLEHPSVGSVEVLDLITHDANDPDQALAMCAETFMDVTFPALRALFDGVTQPGTEPIELSSYTPSLGRSIKWEVYTGQLQVLNDPRQSLAQRLGRQPPFFLAFDTLTGYLADPCFHWCKLYGTQTRQSGLVFGCAIDGTKSPQAEVEMHAKFSQTASPPGEWEFRQFLVMRPSGEADGETTRELQKRAQGLPRAKKRWWSGFFGS